MFRRLTAAVLAEALRDSPVVLLNGARQTGKSTLVQTLAIDGHPAAYVTLDDATAFAAAVSDPAGFLAGFDGPVVIDEVQRAPGLFRALKAEVDRRRTPGRFLLTGSADILLLPHLSESLAGRMEVHTLWPLSQGEIEGVEEGFIDALFAPRGALRIPRDLRGGEGRADLVRRIAAGGLPEPLQRASEKRRAAWFSSYVSTLLSRDVRDLANVEGLTALPRLLALLAARTASLVNFAEISRATGLPQSTLKRYIALLETLFLVQPVPAWSANVGKRLVRAPKLSLVDTGLAAHLQGIDEKRLLTNGEQLGPLLESFVALELRKQRGWSHLRTTLFHFRSHAGAEVDLVLEDPSGRCVGIEVKASASVGPQHLRSLRAFAELAGRRFHRGVVLYTGSEAVAFGDELYALPVSALWRLGVRG
ncbi:MAG: ATP-binding protein [Myxococcales bacterium]|nr:ATP-binding protein [Myxococcales bacterium]